MFNSAQCIHKLLSILMLVRIHLGFRKILVVNDSWHLVIIVTASTTAKSIELITEGQAMVLSTNIYQNNNV